MHTPLRARRRTTIQTLERAFAHNLLDFVQTAARVVPNMRAAAARCGGGIAAFLGDDSPLTTVKGAGASLAACDINAAEDFFRQHGSRVAVFELAPWTR